MADKIKKFLSKLPKKDLLLVRGIIEKVLTQDLKRLNVVKLKGSKNIYRARKGSFRVIYKLSDYGIVKILSVSRRNEKTYKDL